MTVGIVGAGLAGLTAAAALRARGVEVIVFEARDAVGGRTRGIEVGAEQWADAGAAYLGSRHTELLALLAEHGVALEPTLMEGDSTFLLDGRHEVQSTRMPPLNAVALGDMFDRLEELVAGIDPERPWRSRDAEYLDRTSAQEWAESVLTHPDARLFFPLFIGEMMAADPADISLLHMGFYLRSGGGIRYLNAFEGGAQHWRVSGGAHRLSESLAASLGARIRLSSPVLAIDQLADRVEIVTGAGVTAVDAVVVAVPPALAGTIEYRPALPAQRSTSRSARGCAVKVHLVYPTPWWREQGLSGWSVSSDGPLLSTVDDSPQGGSVGVLTGFVTGVEAKAFAGLPAEKQRIAAVEHAQRIFPGLPEPERCVITNWLDEPYSRGCYAALFAPMDWSVLGPGLRQPHDRVHWAGTETSLEYFGLMEGAIRSGMRAAAEIEGVNG